MIHAVPAITDGNRRWWILVAMTGCLSMIFVDTTAVGVALPTIQRELKLSQTELQWVVSSYLLTLAALVAVGGRLGEIFGHARVLKLGAVVYVAASAACGFAQSGELLIAARAVQGIGGALMLPPSIVIVINAFSASERGRAMGIYAAIANGFFALGPLVGGVLTQGLTWRAVFWINIPIGAAVLVAVSATVPPDQPPSRTNGLRRRRNTRGGARGACPGVDAVAAVGLGIGRRRRVAGARCGAVAGVRSDRGASQRTARAAEAVREP